MIVTTRDGVMATEIRLTPAPCRPTSGRRIDFRWWSDFRDIREGRARNLYSSCLSLINEEKGEGGKEGG